jgi:hypothetical protein
MIETALFIAGLANSQFPSSLATWLFVWGLQVDPQPFSLIRIRF